MPRPSPFRRRLLRICWASLALLWLVWLISLIVEIRYVVDTPWTGPIASLERGIIYYAVWGNPPPKAGIGWEPWDGVKGLSLHKSSPLTKPAPPIPPNRSCNPRMICLTGQPRVKHRITLFIPTILLLVVSYILAKHPRPHPPGHCPECGYDLRGNTSGVCPECGERTPMVNVE